MYLITCQPEESCADITLENTRINILYISTAARYLFQSAAPLLYGTFRVLI